MDYTHSSTEALLASLIGEEATSKCYRGALRSLFEGDTGYDDVAPLFVARELVYRWLAEDLAVRDALSSPDIVRNFLRLAFQGQDYETFIVLFLDAQNRLIQAEVMFRGTLTQTAVYPREIVKRGLQLGAAAVIFAHNHPSGVAEPSRADESITIALKQALALVDVKVLDHLVVAGNDVTSLAERGVV